MPVYLHRPARTQRVLGGRRARLRRALDGRAAQRDLHHAQEVVPRQPVLVEHLDQQLLLLRLHLQTGVMTAVNEALGYTD